MDEQSPTLPPVPHEAPQSDSNVQSASVPADVAEHGRIALNNEVVQPQNSAPNGATDVPKHVVGEVDGEHGKGKLPIGIVVIIILQLVNGVLTFFRGNNSSIPYMAMSGVGFVLAIGLLFRQDIVRQLMLILSILVIVFGPLSILGMTLNERRLNQNATNVAAAIRQLSPSTTAQQRESYTSQEASAVDQKNAADKGLVMAEAGTALGVVLGIFNIVYLTRPKVRAYESHKN